MMNPPARRTSASEPGTGRTDCGGAGPADSEEHNLVASAETVTSLGPSDTGRWLVITSGTRHEWDLDAGTYRRLPGPGRGAFAHDETLLVLTRVERWPSIGGTSLIYFDDPAFPALIEHWRQSGRIRRIERLVDLPPS